MAMAVSAAVLRALHERPEQLGFEIVALNDLADQASVEYLTRFDSTHGRFPGEVKVDGDCLHINGDCVKVLRSPTPETIDWQALRVDLVLECSGQYTNRAQAERFLRAARAGAVLAADGERGGHRRHHRLWGQPAGPQRPRNAGVQRLLHDQLRCRCSLLNEAIGLEYVSITTIHSAMNDQPVIDAYHHEDLRRTRSAFQSVIPVSTGLARGIERLLPELAGRIQAKAIRVPTVNVSALDITLQTSRDTSAAEINRVLREAAESGAARTAGLYRAAARQLRFQPRPPFGHRRWQPDPRFRASPGQPAGLVRQRMGIRQPYARRRRTLPARRRA